MMRSRYILASLTLSFLLAGVAEAQQIDPVQFVITPEVPGPQEQVRIEAQGVGSFLGEANITWTRDNKVEAGGVGERVFTFTTGALGERTSVRVSINSPTQGVMTRTFVFVPSLLNLVWEADTYTPPLYRGKALYSAGSPLKVVAIPTVILNGVQVANSSISFQWQRNGEAVTSASGLGRSVFSFIGDQLQPAEQIQVDAYLGTSLVGRGAITIPASSPMVVLYNRDPLRGVVYEQAFPQSIALTGKEITVQAEPYYFSNANKNDGAVSYTWLLNGQETSGPDAAQGILTLRQEGGGTGSAALSVSAQNNDVNRLIQQAGAAVQIFFGPDAAAETSPFGAAVATFTRLAQNAQILITKPNQQFIGGGYSNYNNYQNIPASIGVTPGQLQYTPLEPIPGASSFAQSGTTGSIGPYLSGLFRLLVIGGALFAVLMLTVSGVRYMTAELGLPQMQKARERIKASVFGLLLLAASWLILNTINPDLLNFNLNIGQVLVQGSHPPGFQEAGGAQSNSIQFFSQQQTDDLLKYYKSNPSFLCTVASCAKSISGGLILPDSTFQPDSYFADAATTKAYKDFVSQCTANGQQQVERIVNHPFNLSSGSKVYICGSY